MWTKHLGNFLTGFSRVPVNLSLSHFFVLLWSKPKSGDTKVIHVVSEAKSICMGVCTHTYAYTYLEIRIIFK